MKFKTKATSGIVLVLAFLALFIWGRNAESAELGLGVGYGINHTAKAAVQEITISTDDYRWYGQVIRIGGDGVLDDNWRYSAGYRLFWRRDENVKPFLRLGAAYFDHAPVQLVSDHLTFDMGLGLRWKDIIELEYNHNSTAGRSDKNTGIDFVTLRVVFQFDL